MGLFDRVTANVLKRVVAKFVLEKRPAPKRNELLEGPRIPGAFEGVLCAAEQVFWHDRDRSLLTDTRTHLKRPQITSCCDENTEFLCGGCPILTTTYERWSLNPQKWAPILARQLARGRYVCFACFQSNIHCALTSARRVTRIQMCILASGGELKGVASGAGDDAAVVFHGGRQERSCFKTTS